MRAIRVRSPARCARAGRCSRRARELRLALRRCHERRADDRGRGGGRPRARHRTRASEGTGREDARGRAARRPRRSRAPCQHTSERRAHAFAGATRGSGVDASVPSGGLSIKGPCPHSTPSSSGSCRASRSSSRSRRAATFSLFRICWVGTTWRERFAREVVRRRAPPRHADRRALVLPPRPARLRARRVALDSCPRRRHHRRRLAWLLLLSAIPGAIIGAAFQSTIEDELGDPILIGINLIVFGLVLEWADQARGETRNGRLPSVATRASWVSRRRLRSRRVSRSGVTITAGRWLHFNRESATRQSRS